MIAEETAYLIEPLKDKPREIATDTGFIGRFDSVDAHFRSVFISMTSGANIFV